MCKHILFNNFDPKTDLETLQNFAAKTYDRDGYGAVFRLDDNRIETLKAIDPHVFYLNLGMIIAENQIKDLVVHHRTSTNKLGLEYTHPFEFQGNYLTHNGVVDVPDVHDTKTQNDSELLLHHLMKTNFETKTIEGYFSCFILNERETTILVDETAPIYTDGRIFSSHDLSESKEDEWHKVTLKKIVIPADGSDATISDIEVAPRSNYGMDKAHLSLAYKGSDYTVTSEREEFWKDYEIDQRLKELTQNAEDFMYIVSENEEQDFFMSRSNKELKKKIRAKAQEIGMKLNGNEIHALSEYYLEEMKILEERVQ